MSWHFSAGLVAEYLAANCSDGEPSAPWSSMPFAPDDSCSDKMKGTCHRSPFGTMFVPSTDALGAALLTSFRLASPAKTLAPLGVALESTEKDPASGLMSSGSFVKWDPIASNWKTHQCSLLGGWVVFSETWPRWGTMRNGECWERITPELPTKGKDGGWWPTPTATDYKGGTAAIRKDTGRVRTDLVRHVCKVEFGLTYPIPEHSEALMGWPIGWTDSKPLATDKFQQWLHSHGKS